MKKKFVSFLIFFIFFVISIMGSRLALAEEKISSAAPLKYDEMLTLYQYPFPFDKYKFSSQGKNLEMAYMYLVPKKQNSPTVLLYMERISMELTGMRQLKCYLLWVSVLLFLIK